MLKSWLKEQKSTHSEQTADLDVMSPAKVSDEEETR